MFKTEYELFWVNLAMTSYMFRPDGYFNCFMKKIISAICRTIIIGGSWYPLPNRYAGKGSGDTGNIKPVLLECGYDVYIFITQNHIRAI